MSIRKAAKLYNISPATIASWKKDISIKPANRSPRKIAEDALRQDIINYPDAYYYERAARLGCSKSGIELAMKRLGYTLKKILEHPKASWLKRLGYQLNLERYKRQGYPIIYMDESGFEKEVLRAFGYSPQGLPCIDQVQLATKA